MKTFAQKLDFTILTAGEMIEDHGEDNYYSVIGENCAIAAVFDGCGGIGSRKYPRYANHTGAYMASRAASGALRDWFYESESAQDAAGSARGGESAARIKSYMERALAVVGRHAGPTSRIFGTMVRDFPSTAAIAIVRNTDEGTELQCFWCGDSRVYLLDQSGLAQLTADDVEGRNAMSNLTSDGALTNVIALDDDFEIHFSRPLRFREKDAYSVFAATDGCFGYLPTPMDFEDMLLGTLENSQSVSSFERKLDEKIRSTAGDDYTLAWMSFGYGDFPRMKAEMKKRRETLQRDYIGPLLKDGSDQKKEELWESYRVYYERFLSDDKTGGKIDTEEASDKKR